MSSPLNKEQLKAAKVLHGLLLINAGAGSGKTRTLTERLVCSVVPKEVEGWESADIGEIAAITFTEKAAGELGERVRASLREAGRMDDARRVDTAWISTIHSFCSRILRRHALEAGVDPAFAVVHGVRGGVAREEAFEQAARDALETSSGVDLFEAYSYSALYQAADRLRLRMLADRLELVQVMTEETRSSTELFAEAREYFEYCHVELQTCDLKGAYMSAHADQCEATARALFETADDMEASEAGATLRRILGNYTQKQGVKAHAELCADIVQMRARFASEAAALEAHNHVRALIELTGLYAMRYGEIKTALGALDFDDLQSCTLRLFEERPEVANRYRALFRLVMVDEFQDTDGLQLALVQAVSQDNLCTVGDERQSIYRFRGADVHVYRAHNEEMLRRGAQEVELQENYRSHPGVLVFVNQLFGSPEFFGPEGLIELRAGRIEPEKPAVDAGQPRVEIIIVDKVSRVDKPARQAEAREIATRFKRLLGAFVPSEMVILLRSYRHAAMYAEALQKEGITARIVGGSRFFELPEVSYLRVLIRVLANPHDDEAFAYLLGSPLVGLSPDALWRLAHGASGTAPIGGLWTVSSATAGLSASDRILLDRAHGVVDAARCRVGSLGLDEIVLRAVEELDYDRYLLGNGDSGRQTYANVLKFARMAADFEQTERGGPAAFAVHLDASERLGEHESPAALSDDRSPAVRIMSIHSSKGLEFPVVAVAELASGVRGDDGILRVRHEYGQLRVALSSPSQGGEMPAKSPLFESIDETDKRDEIDEVKRVLYVACTRACEVLILSGSAKLSRPPTQESPIAWIRSALKLDVSAEVPEMTIGLGSGQKACVSVVHEDERGMFTEQHKSSPDRPAGTTPEPGAILRAQASPDRDPAESQPGRGSDVRHITYSDIGEYEMCALRYRATRLWRMGFISTREDAQGPLAFGSALHAVLQLVMVNLVEVGERTNDIARYYGLSQEGLERLRLAEKTLAESALVRRLRSCDRFLAEVPFEMGLHDRAGEEFLLRGSIDLLGRTAEHVMIVDYKTGISGEPEELAARYEAQARCYALAALNQGAKQVELHFVRPEVESEDGEPQVICFEYGSDDAGELTDYVVMAHSALAAGIYEPLASWNERACGTCPIAGGVCSASRAVSQSDC